MPWKYKYIIYVSPNRVKDTRGDFATKEEVDAAARERIKQLVSSVNSPGGPEVFTYEVIEEKKK